MTFAPNPMLNSPIEHTYLHEYTCILNLKLSEFCCLRKHCLGNYPPSLMFSFTWKILPFPILWLSYVFWLDTHQERDSVLGVPGIGRWGRDSKVSPKLKRLFETRTGSRQLQVASTVLFRATNSGGDWVEDESWQLHSYSPQNQSTNYIEQGDIWGGALS